MMNDGAGRRWLAAVKVDGKQGWVFETSRLRDAVGASHLIAEIEGKARAAGRLLGGEEVVAASGLARFAFAERGAATAWVTAITRDFALRAPGMEVVGAVVELGGDLDDATRRALERLDRNAARLGGAALLDRALPWSQPCHYSGWPSLDVVNPVGPEHRQGRRVGAGVYARRRKDVFDGSRERVEGRLRAAGLDEGLIRRINDAWRELDPSEDGGVEPLSTSDTWRGVIHADANGLGRIYRRFGALSDALGDRGFDAKAKRLRDLSAATDRVTWRALARAIQAVFGGRRDTDPLPVYPLLVGGDDVTVVTDGRYALGLAWRFLYAFEEETRKDPVFQQVLSEAQRQKIDIPSDGLRAAAGVAIVKHHFPFGAAYTLADAACDRTKRRLRTAGRSGLDWHAALDASPPDLDTIRERLRVDGARLTRRPYATDELPGLQRAAAALRARDKDGRFVVPRAQLHAVREGLFLGQAEANARFGRADQRTGGALGAAVSLLHDPEAALFVPGDDGPETGLLDAFDHLGLMEGFALDGGGEG